MADEPFDAVVIGSGAGGGAAAFGLTRAGLRVLVLERGPKYEAKDFVHDELAICRRSFFVPNPVDDPRMVSKDGGPFVRSGDGWISTCVGGGTVHMSGYFFRMHPDDLRAGTRYGLFAGATPADWPLDFRELEPWYEEAERIVGVSGAETPFETRRRPLPLAPLLAHPSAELIERTCRKLGLRSFPIPRAIVSADYGGRQACSYCGFCGSYGCEVGAKSSTQVTFLASAQRTGRLVLRPSATALRIEAPKARASSVVWRDARGVERRASGRAIVVACSAIESARLLLESGLANASGLLGKNLQFGAFSTGAARFPRGADAFPAEAERLPFTDRAVQDFYEGGGTLLFQRPHPNPIFQAERLAWNRGGPPAFGAELKRRLREFFHETHTLEWEGFSAFLPHDGCDVTLDPSVKDRAGRRVARLRIAVHPQTLRWLDALAAHGRAVLDAAGALRHVETTDERVYPVLQAGTARMGKDPARSVLDAACEAHDVKNLFVADSSSFPSTGAAPFTLTILANALRVADGIARRARRREL